MHATRLSLAAVVLGCALVCPASAQTAWHFAPRRPHLAAEEDTNSAAAYYRLGAERIRRDPETAAAAFHWAAQLDPAWAEALYAEQVALRLRDPNELERYFEMDRGTLASPEIAAYDSVLREAWVINPFLVPRFDELLATQYFYSTRIIGVITVYADPQEALRAQHDARVDRYLEGNADNPDFRGWMALARGQFVPAARYFADMETRYPRSYLARVYRSRALMMLGMADSAAAELGASVDLSQVNDTTEIRFVYRSKELLQYARGVALQAARDTGHAGAAFRQALVENLGFWPAHIRLATMALAAHDTALAVREAQAAVDARETDFTAQMLLGLLLAVTHHMDDAVAHVERAAALKAFAAAPYSLLGKIQEAAGHRADAVAAYTRFVALAARDNPERAALAAHLALLQHAP